MKEYLKPIIEDEEIIIEDICNNASQVKENDNGIIDDNSGISI